jgi:osmotically inducible protein OsmC
VAPHAILGQKPTSLHRAKGEWNRTIAQNIRKAPDPRWHRASTNNDASHLITSASHGVGARSQRGERIRHDVVDVSDPFGRAPTGVYPSLGIMAQIEKVVYTAKTHTTGGRENGASRSSDGSLDIRLSSPGSARFGTNPEQLFAAGWSAGLERAITQAARKRKLVLPADLAVDAEVDLCRIDDDYFLCARLDVSLPGIEREIAQALVDEAQQACPYNKATRGNINVAIMLMPTSKPSEKGHE